MHDVRNVQRDIPQVLNHMPTIKFHRHELPSVDRRLLYGDDLPAGLRFTDRDGCFFWCLVALSTLAAVLAIGVWSALYFATS